MVARRTDVVGAWAAAQPGLGANQHLAAAFAQGLAEHLLGCAIDIAAVEKGSPALNRDINQPRGGLVADAGIGIAATAEIGSAQPDGRHIQP